MQKHTTKIIVIGSFIFSLAFIQIVSGTEVIDEKIKYNQTCIDIINSSPANLEEADEVKRCVIELLQPIINGKYTVEDKFLNGQLTFKQIEKYHTQIVNNVGIEELKNKKIIKYKTYEEVKSKK